MTAFIQFLADESVGLQHQAVASVRLGRLARGQGAGNGGEMNDTWQFAGKVHAVGI